MRITLPSKPAPRHRGMPCQHCSDIVERTVLTWIDGTLMKVCVPCLTAEEITKDDLDLVMGLAR